MKRLSIFAGLVSGIMMMAGVAYGLNSNVDAMSESGNHQFYVWCTGADDYVQVSQGSNAKDAQEKLAARAGNNCWPVWQGLEG